MVLLKSFKRSSFQRQSFGSESYFETVANTPAHHMHSSHEFMPSNLSFATLGSFLPCSELMSGQREYKRRMKRLAVEEKFLPFEETKVGKVNKKLRVLLAMKDAAVKKDAARRAKSPALVPSFSAAAASVKFALFPRRRERKWWRWFSKKNETGFVRITSNENLKSSPITFDTNQRPDEIDRRFFEFEVFVATIPFGSPRICFAFHLELLSTAVCVFTFFVFTWIC